MITDAEREAHIWVAGVIDGALSNGSEDDVAADPAIRAAIVDLRNQHEVQSLTRLAPPQEMKPSVGGHAGPLSPCTGETARWCPVHGDCLCEIEPNRADPACPLHAEDSDHPGEGGIDSHA